MFSQELHQAKREATGMSDSPPMSHQLTQEVEEVDLPSPTNRRQLLAEEHRLVVTGTILFIPSLLI